MTTLFLNTNTMIRKTINNLNLRVGLFAVLKTTFKPFNNYAILKEGFNYTLEPFYSLTLSYDDRKFYSTSSFQPEVRTRKSKIVKPWLHKEIELSHGSEYIELSSIQKFLHSLNQDNNYMLLIVIITEQGMKMAPNKIIEKVSYFYNAETLKIIINSEISTIVQRYHIEHVYNVVFRYREFVSKVPIIIPTSFNKNSIPISRKEKNDIFTDYFAPFSLESRNFGRLIDDKGDIKKYLYQDRFILERELKIEKDPSNLPGPGFSGENFYTKVINKDNENIIFKFIDKRINKFSFVREIKGYSLHLNKGKITMFESETKCKFIQPLIPDHIEEKEMGNFITYDLECYKDENNNFVPYAAAWHKKNITKIYYLTDFKDHINMIQKSLEDLFVKENKNCIVYIHNNKNFDSIFILKPLLHSTFDYKFESIQKGKNILSLSITKDSGTKNSIKITLKDSFMLLPSSLRELCKSYKLDEVKGTFPHNFASFSNLNYIGTLPSFEFFEKDSFKNFKEYFILFWITKSNWDFKKELIKYLKLDVITLHKIILIVRKLTYEEEKVDITKVLSNAGLSFRIFKINYLTQTPGSTDLNKNLSSQLIHDHNLKKFVPKIPILSKTEYNFMKEGYFGGHTDLFIPRINWGFLYDINSQYPFAMTKPMPTGNPIYSNDNNLDNYFGVVKAKITTPEYMKYPILPVKFNDKLTRYVLGNWVGVYCSEELKEARDVYGYKIEVIEGYKFEKG